LTFSGRYFEKVRILLKSGITQPLINKAKCIETRKRSIFSSVINLIMGANQSNEPSKPQEGPKVEKRIFAEHMYKVINSLHFTNLMVSLRVL